ncbi:hypothetical protein B0181_04195 [Moraxella caviae]|uniref:Uncharacterized protein n=1 Tax=Moraxella caviae TaxID=34060 RepID=A0A1T0A5E4_9GAMM|nr:hypothetical protein [Moraxella caviae]OOR90808.1 hypothetical protein B0181_04195 [Moraxella caviae]STZ10636.1 Uncharacterised protein [Moraxella caviae]
MNEFQTLIGDSLHRIQAGVYFEHRNTENFSLDDIMDICLIFEKFSITLSTNQDGETLDIDLGNNLRKIDMGDHGVIEIQDLSGLLGLKKGLVVQDVLGLINEYGVNFGFELGLEDKKLVIKNIGDQLIISL